MADGIYEKEYIYSIEVLEREIKTLSPNFDKNKIAELEHVVKYLKACNQNIERYDPYYLKVGKLKSQRVK